MLYGLVIAIHISACLILIGVILLQAGRGGGLSETFGGGDTSQTIFGTKMSVFLTRATVVAASLFLITCMLLGIMTTRRGKSLIDLRGIAEEPKNKDTFDTKDLPLAEPEKIPQDR